MYYCIVLLTKNKIKWWLIIDTDIDIMDLNYCWHLKTILTSTGLIFFMQNVLFHANFDLHFLDSFHEIHPVACKSCPTV